MKKRLIAGALALGMALSCTVALPGNNVIFSGIMTADAGFGTTNYDSTNTYTITKSDAGYTITGFNTSAAIPVNYTIPSTLTATIDNVTATLPVVALGSGFLQSNSSITSVTVPSGITAIPARFCAGATKLQTVTINGAVTTIGTGAFGGCTALKEITIPKSVTSIGDDAFNSMSDSFVFKCYINTYADQWAVDNGFTPYYIDNPGHVHSYQLTASKAANCGSTGSETYTCSCGASYTKTLPKVGTHQYGEEHVVAPTYTDRGYTYKECTVCGYQWKYNYTAALTKTTITDDCISGINSTYTYDNGIAINPLPTVKVDGTTLVKDTDYLVTYSTSAYNIGNTVTVTVTGMGSYTGTGTAKFTIVSSGSSTTTTDISSATIEYTDSSDGVYNYTGSAITPGFTIKLGTKTLTTPLQYTYTITNNTNVGNGVINVTGKNSYSGTATFYFTIKSAGTTVTNLSTATVTLSQTSVAYTGSAITSPVPTVKVGSTTLTKGTDYDVSYSNNTNVGTATVTVTGKGSYAGTNSATFSITALNLSNATIGAIADQTYTGSALTPAPTVKYGSKTLTAGTDYTVSYSNNTNAGTATVTVTGKGNYTGTKQATFKIVSSATGRTPGDVNGDNSVDIDDVLLIQQKIAKWDVTINEANANVNGDSTIDIDDVLLIQQKIAKWDVTLQ
ncbi:MAG: leucine-rich repeat protein [Ruminococcus sp.]|nr:leucine-rich repeat protein [Ruminococcus sp.]